MADETAKTSLVFDASGAQKGAADFRAASEQVIAAENAATTAVDAGEVKKAASRGRGAKAAQDSAAVQVAAAKAGADAVVTSADRILRSTTQQMATLDRYAKMWDPLAAAAGRAAKQLDTVWDIAQKTKGDVQVRALSMMTEAVDRLNTATRNLAAGFDVDKRIAELTARFDPATTSARAMTAQLKDLNDAQRLGIIGGDAYLAEQQRIIESYDQGAQAAAKAAAQQREMIAAAQATQAAQNAQAATADPRTILGLSAGAGTGSAQASAAVFEEATQAQAALAAQMQQLEAQFDPITTAARKYASALEDINAAVSLEVISEEEAAAQRAKQATSYGQAATSVQAATRYLGNYGESAFAARFATQQLGVQTVQFFSSLQAGQPFIQAFIGQAHQLVDVAIATGTGFKTLATGVASFFTSIGRWVVANPIVTAMIATTAALFTMGAMAEATARRVENLKNVLSGVRGDYVAASAAAEQLAKSLAASSATMLTTAQSREAAQTLFQGGFSGTVEQGQAVVKVFADLSKVVGEAQPNFKRLAEAMQDPAAVMQQLLDQNHLRGLNQELVNNVKRMQDAGNYAGAAAAAMQAFINATKNVPEGNQTPLEKALKGLEEAFKRTGQAGRSFAETIGTAMTNAAAAVINGMASMIPLVQRFLDHLSGKGNIATATGDFTSFLPGDQQKLLAAPGAQPTVLSSAGAAGIMQLMPGTAAGLGVNPFIPNENVLGGLKYIQQLATQMQSFPGGVEQGVARSYLTGPHGNVMSGAATDYSEKVFSADVSKLPTETAAMIDFWGKTLNLPPNLIALGKRIATVESGGVQGPTNATQAFVTPPGAVQTVPVAPTKTTAELLPTGNEFQKALDDAAKLTKGYGLLYDKQKDLAGQQKLLETAVAISFTTGDIAGAIKYSTALQALAGQQYLAISPQQEFIKGLKQQAETAQIVTEGDRRMAEALQQLNELNKQHPDTASEQQRGQVINAVLEQQSGAYKQLAHETELQIAQQDALTLAYGQGYAAVAKVTAATQAYNDAIKLFPAGTQRQAAQEALTQQNLRRATSTQETAAAQQSLQNQDTLTIIQAETDTLMQNNAQRTLYLAHLKNELEAKRLLPNASEAVRQKYVQEADAIAGATLELQRQQNALATISGAFESAFDTIGNSITQALLQGQGAAINWRNIMTSVAQQVLQAFLKMAVLNPILNSLFGGNRSTITDVFDTLNKTTPGSSSTSDSSGGFAGSLIGLALKGIGLIGGGVDSSSFDPGTLGAVGDASGLTPGGQALQSLGLFQPLPAHHAGGIVGSNDNLPMTLFPTAMIAGLPRFHGGLGGNEFAAILQKGERVLTEQQQQQVQAAANGGGDTVSISIDARNSTPEAVNSFRRSLPQIAGIMSDQMTKAKMRNR